MSWTKMRRCHPILLACAVWFLIAANGPWRSFGKFGQAREESLQLLTTATNLSNTNNVTTTRTQCSQNNRCELSSAAQKAFFASESFNRFDDFETTKQAVQTLNHVFVKSQNPMWMCIAPKTGCTSWLYFLLFVNEGILIPPEQIRQNSLLIHGQKARYRWSPGSMRQPPEEVMRRFSEHPHFVVARNPYVRFVSSWKDYCSRLNRPNLTLPTFLKLYKEQKIYLKDHVDPISVTCNMRKPLNFTVLRIEEQTLWFDAFVEHYGMSRFMKNYTDRGLMVFKPTLDDSTNLTDVVHSAAGLSPWPGGTFESSHHYGSMNTFTTFYTPQLAAEVTDLFRDDFVNFQYPLWDGRPETFRFV